MMHRIERTFAGRKLIIETGRMAKQAAGSCLITFGETMVLVPCGMIGTPMAICAALATPPTCAVTRLTATPAVTTWFAASTPVACACGM